MSNTPPNGGSTEYGNLMGRLGGIRELLDTEFGKKLLSGELLGIVAAIAGVTNPALGAIAANNIVPFQRTNVTSLISQVGSIGDDIGTAAANIAKGGIGGTGSTLLWSVRDLMDNTQNLAELAAENSAKVNNALRRAGQTFDTGAWMPENYNHRTLLHRKLTNLNEFLGGAQNLAQVFEELTSTTIEIQENINEINENNEKFQKALKEGEKVIRDDNAPVKAEEDTAKQKPNAVTSVTGNDLTPAGD